jgi:hypothetical protein
MREARRKPTPWRTERASTSESRCLRCSPLPKRRQPDDRSHDPEGEKHGRKRLAYALEEVGKHLELFAGAEPIVISSDDGPYTPEISQHLIRAVIGVAAFAGLRDREIRGQ